MRLALAIAVIGVRFAHRVKAILHILCGLSLGINDQRRARIRLILMPFNDIDEVPLAHLVL